MRALLALFTVAGCTGDISNALFVEDARFRAALPDPALLSVRWPVDPALPEGADPDPFLLRATVNAVGATELWVGALTTAVAPAISGTPTTRGDDYRVWGPYPWDDYPGYFLRVEMSRTANASLYTFALGVSNASSGPWREFFTGTHVPDASALAGWQGELVWDVTRLSAEISGAGEGLITLRYAGGEPRVVELEVVGWRDGQSATTDALSTCTVDADGAGAMELVGEIDVNGGGGIEHIQMVSQWTALGEGRADAVFSAGDLGSLRPAPGQCWGADGLVVWQLDDTGTWPTVGDEALCAEGLLPGEPELL